MSFESDTDAGLQDAIDVMGTPFIWNSQTYHGIQSDNGATFDLDSGGFTADAAFSLHCIKADFDPLPVVGETLTLDSKDYRISKLNTSAQDPGVEFVCEGVNK